MPPRPSSSPSSYRPPTVVGLLVMSMVLPQTPAAILGHRAPEREMGISCGLGGRKWARWRLTAYVSHQTGGNAPVWALDAYVSHQAGENVRAPEQFVKVPPA
jgi:hypothetical protein